MANTDSFIEEVNEELRRDRLFALFRKWGWIPILLILLIVGAAGYREYTLSQERAAAEAFGDSLIAALDDSEAEAREAALLAVTPATDNAQVLLALLLAAERASDEAGRVTAAEGLRALAAQPGLSARYRDLALLKAHLLDPQEFSLAMVTLDRLALPGQPYRPLAMEQQALLHVGNGDIEAAIAILRLLEEDSQATAGLQQRASQLIVALEAGVALADPAPEEEAAPDAPAAGEGAEEDAAEQETADPVEEAAPEAPAETTDEGGDDTPAEDGAVQE